MKTLIKLIAFAGVMFGVSAAGSWWMTSRQSEAPAAEADAAGVPPVPGVASSTAPVQTPPPTGELPVPVRPKVISPEELLRNAMSLRSREEALRQQEAEAEKRRARLELVQADIQGEQTEIEGLAAQVKSQIDAANALITKVAEERSRLEQERQQSATQLKEFEEAQTKMDAVETQNIKRMATWIQGMEPTASAEFLRELVNDGKMDIAVQILSNFEERQASKVLSEIDDPALVIELADKFRTLQRPEKATTRR
jgi:flagellar motility protein MotE (MotC chaperone)